eukprot:11973-Heterococcus_DN1.PRE.4
MAGTVVSISFLISAFTSTKAADTIIRRAPLGLKFGKRLSHYHLLPKVAFLTQDASRFDTNRTLKRLSNNCHFDSARASAVLRLQFSVVTAPAIRLFFASKGNKTEITGPLISAGVLGAVVALAYVYSLALQTYVLKLDVVLASIGLVFVGLQTLLSLGTVPDIACLGNANGFSIAEAETVTGKRRG